MGGGHRTAGGGRGLRARAGHLAIRGSADPAHPRAAAGRDTGYRRPAEPAARLDRAVSRRCRHLPRRPHRGEPGRRPGAYRLIPETRRCHALGDVGNKDRPAARPAGRAARLGLGVRPGVLRGARRPSRRAPRPGARGAAGRAAVPDLDAGTGGEPGEGRTAQRPPGAYHRRRHRLRLGRGRPGRGLLGRPRGTTPGYGRGSPPTARTRGAGSPVRQPAARTRPGCAAPSWRICCAPRTPTTGRRRGSCGRRMTRRRCTVPSMRTSGRQRWPGPQPGVFELVRAELSLQAPPRDTPPAGADTMGE